MIMKSINNFFKRILKKKTRTNPDQGIQSDAPVVQSFITSQLRKNQDAVRDIGFFNTFHNLVNTNINHCNFRCTDILGQIEQGVPFNIFELLNYQSVSELPMHRSRVYVGINQYPHLFKTDKASLSDILEVGIITKANSFLSLLESESHQNHTAKFIKIGNFILGLQVIDFNHPLHKESILFTERYESIETTKGPKYLIPNIFAPDAVQKIAKCLNRLYQNNESVLMTLIDIEPVDLNGEAREAVMRSILKSIPRHLNLDNKQEQDILANICTALEKNKYLKNQEWYGDFGIHDIKESIAARHFLLNLQSLNNMYHAERDRMRHYFLDNEAPINYSLLELIALKITHSQPISQFFIEDSLYSIVECTIKQNIICSNLQKGTSYYGHSIGFRGYNNNPYLIIQKA
jgi:hypothetical protein